MGSWDNLPNEILENIMLSLGSSHFTVPPTPITKEWMLVNKQWLNLYYILAYKKVTIDFKKLGKAPLSTIFNSVFQPGTWVKSINFKGVLYPPPSISFLAENKFTFNQQPYTKRGGCLQYLMKLCPYVEQVEFDNIKIWEHDWAKYLQVLIQGNWKLKRLQTMFEGCVKIDEFDDISKSCILHFKDTLTSLSLTSNPTYNTYRYCIQKRFDFLMNLKNLETLQISGPLMCNSNHIYQLLQVISSSKKVRIIVDFPKVTPTLFQLIQRNYKHKKLDQELWTKNYSHIQHLDLNYCVPDSEQEVLFFMNKFQHLESLRINGTNAKDGAWFALFKMSQETRVSFLKFLFKLPIFSIIIPASYSDERDLLRFYYDVYQQHHQSNSTLKLVIDFDPSLWENHSSYDYFTSKIQIDGDKRANNGIHLTFCHQDNYLNRRDLSRRAMIILMNNSLQRHFNEFIINTPNCYFDLCILFYGILINENENLKTIKFSRGKLGAPNARMEQEVQYKAQPTMTQLKFYFTEIHPEAFSWLSKYYHTLDLLCLDHCSIYVNKINSNKEQFAVFLPHTNIKHLDMKDGRVFKASYRYGLNSDCQQDFIIKDDEEEEEDKTNLEKRMGFTTQNNAIVQDYGEYSYMEYKYYCRPNHRKIIVILQSIDQDFTKVYIINPSKSCGEQILEVPLHSLDFYSFMKTSISLYDLILLGKDIGYDDIFVQIQVKSIEKLSFSLYGLNHDLLERTFPLSSS